MRSNTLNMNTVRQLTKGFSQTTHAAINRLMLGLGGRQWLASLLIGLLLSPTFSLPVQATIVANPTVANANNFEPVNPPRFVWENAWMNLNDEIEEWLTTRRDGNDAAADIDKKKPVTEKPKTDEAPPKKVETKESGKEAAAEAAASKKESPNTAPENNISMTTLKSSAKARRMLPDPPPPVLNENQLFRLLSPQNNLGSPMGQTEAGSTFRALATLTRERAGIGNFSFDVPVASLPGRGIDASVGLTYNSQLWTKTYNGVDIFTYNVDGNWLAPGFQIGYGYLDGYGGGANQIPNQFVLISSDGTRHQLRRGDPLPAWHCIAPTTARLSKPDSITPAPITVSRLPAR